VRRPGGKGHAEVAAALQDGCTWSSTRFMQANEMPHGGLKRSGYGNTMSLDALEDDTVARYVMLAH
jgi:aminobutyraldehyde dehydrogenase